MPRQAHGYEQAPYEAIGAPRYHELAARLRPLRGEIPHDHSDEVRFCDGDVCEFGT